MEQMSELADGRTSSAAMRARAATIASGAMRSSTRRWWPTWASIPGSGVMVIPMTYARMDDELILHGAVASRWLSSFEAGRAYQRLRDPARRPGAGAVGFLAFDELPLCGGVWHGEAGHDAQEKQAAFKALLDHCCRAAGTTRGSRTEGIGATTVLKMRSMRRAYKIRAAIPWMRKRTRTWITGPASYRWHCRRASHSGPGRRTAIVASRLLRDYRGAALTRHGSANPRLGSRPACKGTASPAAKSCRSAAVRHNHRCRPAP